MRVLQALFVGVTVLVNIATAHGQVNTASSENKRSVRPNVSVAQAQALEPMSDVDERLFIIYTLNNTYRNWPSSTTTPQDMSTWLAAASEELKILEARAWEINDSLGSLCADALLLVKRYEDFLVAHNFIEKCAKEEASKLNWWLCVKSGVSTGISGGGYPGMIVGGLFMFVEMLQKQGQLEAAKTKLIEQEIAGLRREFESRIANLQYVANRLSPIYGWPRNSVDFDPSNNDRDRDPFAILEKARAQKMLWSVSPERISLPQSDSDINAAILQGALQVINSQTEKGTLDLYQRVVRLTPATGRYGKFRAGVFLEAAEFANDVCAKEVGNNYSAAPAQSAPQALRLCRAAIAETPSGDQAQFGSVQLSRALGLAGQYREALNAAESATGWHDDPVFEYRRARLLSLVGDSDLAIDVLKQALRLGFSNTTFVKTDPDLEHLRQSKEVQLNDLLKVKWSWRLKEGLVLHDVTLVNESDFTFTNIVFTPSVNCHPWQGTIRNTFRLERLRPGESHRWWGGFSDPRHVSPSVAYLNCDQSK